MLKITEQNKLSPQSRYPASNEYVYGNSNYGQSGLTLMDLWRRLMRQKWLFLLTALLISLLAAWITFSIKPSYRASATIQIEKDSAEVVNFGNISKITPDMGELDPFFRTRYEQLKSRKLAQRVIERLNLGSRLYEPQRNEPLPWLLAQWQAIKTGLKGLIIPPEQQNRVTTGMAAYLNAFQKKLYVEPIEKTHLVNIFFESPDAALSAEVVNTLVKVFMEDNISTQSETDNMAAAFLTQEMDKARERLTASEEALVKYAKENNILEVNNSQSTQENKLNELYNALSQAQRNRIQAEGNMRQGRRHGNSAQVLTNPVITELKRQLAVLEAEYQDKGRIFKPAYPDMQQLAQQIGLIRQKIESETKRMGSSLQSVLNGDYNTAKQLEDKLRAELDAYKAELAGLRDRSIEYNALKREVEISRNLYDGLLQRMKEVNVASGVTPSNISIIDEATPPTDIFRPQRLINLIIGGLVGLLLGAGLALLRESLSQKLHSVEELQSISALPIVGSIPRSRGSESTLALVAARDLGSAISEAYRIAAANLRFATPSGTLPHSTVITSVNPAEGKSTSSVNLALSLAQMGTKVLLIDADLRRPTLHSKMGLSNNKGLSNYLSDQASLSAVTQNFHEVSGLYVMTAGSIVDDPVKMLSNHKMRHLISLSMKHFDAVIIDAPPVTGFADSLLLASMAEATLLVANEQTIDRRKMTNAVEQLQRASKHLAGFLMVKAKERVANERYYKRYQRPRTTAQSVPVVSKKGLNLAS